MWRALAVLLILTCFAVLYLLCFAPAIVQGRQFGYRDAAHYYYPLHARIQQEWEQRRWPLWEPEENGGMPLLGNPTAAVLYPGKLVFALLPYPLAARLYIVAHPVLAFVAMLVLLRSWRTTWIGSGLAALAYTFGAPILFQYCNIIYLVGAAWLPLGIRAVDRWVRLGRRWGLLELAIVLSMQVLGGDPQAAYLLGLAGIGYAAGLAWARARNDRLSEVEPLGRPTSGFASRVFVAASALGLAAVWFIATVLVAAWLPKLREPHAEPPTPPFFWMLWMPSAVNAVWGAVAIGFLYRWRGRGWRFPFGAMSLGLVTAAALACALTAAQLFPIIEFTQQTVRAAGGGPHAMYPFSNEPYRLVEMVWPNVSGVLFEGNSFWADVSRIPGVYPKIWVPSLYLGGLALVLGLGAMTLRHGPPWRIWLSAIAVVSLVGSLGAYTSPIWLTRVAFAACGSHGFEQISADLGPVDPHDATPIRHDGFLRDGDGSIYWWLATFLPGFRQFRYPAKLFTFTALALAALAGLGWDRLCTRQSRSAALWFSFLLVASAVVLAAVLFERQPILQTFQANKGSSAFGPFDSRKGFKAILSSLAQASIVSGSGLILTLLYRRRPALAGGFAVVVMTADLAVANSRYVLTVSQSLLEGRPEILRIIEAEERARPADGPFRVHRMALWNPPGWHTTPSLDRVRDFVAWERGTLQPKYGINFGIEYTHTIGVAELYDYEWFFSPFPRKVRDPKIAAKLGIQVGDEVVYYPRRGFDMWNSRYFVLPYFPRDWRDEFRATAAFLFASREVYPKADQFTGPGGKDEERRWIETQDFRVMKNEQAFPRAWVVHEARSAKPVEGLSRESRRETMEELLYADDPFWSDAGKVSFDAHRFAWVASDILSEITPDLSRQPWRPTEIVKVAYPSPQRAVLDATLVSPGLVVLADVFYPGWELTIDDKPAAIHRVNGLMRGATVPAGKHRLVYTYAPRSFRVGLGVSIVALAALGGLSVLCVRRPVHSVLGDRE
jgi:hypothetical protein